LRVVEPQSNVSRFGTERVASMREFLTDDEIARRLRALEAELRRRGLPTLAADAANLAAILEPADER